MVPPSSSPSPDRWREVLRRRVLVTASLMLLWGIGIEARLIHLQVFRHADLVDRAERQRSRSIATHPKRGEILDREGRVLAYSVDADTVVSVPSEVDDPVGTTRQLCDVLECDAAQRDRIQTRLGQDRPFAYIQRRVSVDAARRIRDLELEGIGFLTESRRFYPNKELAAHVLGFVGIDNQGLHGLEASHDEQVRGRPGRVLVQTDARNRAFSRVESPPTAGVSLELTIDKFIQYIAERELRAAVLEHDAAGGSVIVMDPSTGEILALANEPTFNPNSFSLSTPDSRRNRATQDIYEPGSTFKIVTASAALEEGVFAPSEMIDVSPGVIRFGSHRISDMRNYGELSFADVIVKSSNVGASKIGVTLGPERVGRYVARFGFGQLASRDFAGQSRGIVYDWSQLPDSELASVAIGYNISVTPLQMAAAMSAVANGGELIEPRLVRAQISGNQRLEVAPHVIRRVISPDTASTLTRMLEDVVSRGTARNAQVEGYTAAGKTGTAEKIIGGQYAATGHNVASFVGFVPSTRPALTILVVIDDVVKFGGAVAGPPFQRIAEASLRHLGVPPNVDALPPILVASDEGSGPRVRPVSMLVPTPVSAAPAPAPDGSRMPDLRGLSVRSAIWIATQAGLTTATSGRGFVTTQTPQPGDPVSAGQQVTLRLDRASALAAQVER
jgi:cell division protein FtsI (penicillin-binding protein 3)